MALTITPPEDFSAAYNPVLITATSTVRDDYTVGSSKTISSISSASGFVQLNFSASHGLIKGDYVLITSAAGASYILGRALVTTIVDSDSLIINKAFVTALSGTGTAYKYLNNYSGILKYYNYVDAAPTTPVLVATKTVKPLLVDGFCFFKIDLQSLIQESNFAGNVARDVLNWDLYPVNGTSLQENNQSFVKYGFELEEGFDNPTGGLPSFDPGAIAD